MIRSFLGFALAAALAGVGVVAPAAADTQPPQPGTTPTVSADALPTVQINGIVWAQAVVGNTVFVGGQFTRARPAGAAPGTQEVPRSHFLAYDVRTGVLIGSINVNFNAQVMALAVSPDGRRLYVGGDFTKVNGVTHNRIVAIDTATGAVIESFKAGTWSRVSGITATAGVVYAGGAFTAVMNGTARGGLAAFNATTGALLAWAPKIGGDSARVNAMTFNPSRSKLVVGGNFATVNGVAAKGVAALDPTTGAVQPWPINTVIRNAGPDSAVLSLAADNDSVYGTGYVYKASGTLEGTFRVNGETGQVGWIEDCHGDTYGVWPMGDAVYTVGHAHYCGNVGGFPQTTPWTFRRAVAFTKAPTRTLTKDQLGYPSFTGQPAPTLLHWYPTLSAGTYTGLTQAAWSIAGNSEYVVLGGEFPKVNSVPQQGLVRFAVREVAPNTLPPQLKGANYLPSVAELPSGGIRGTFTANWDQDNEQVALKVIRDGDTGNPIKQVTARTSFWRAPTIGFVDTNVVPGRTYTYRLLATDPYGNTSQGDPVTVTATKAVSAARYVHTVIDDGPSAYWRLGEGSGPVKDWAAGADAKRGAGVTGGVAPAITGVLDPATRFSGATTATVSSPAPIAGPQQFTVEAWLRTTTTKGGKIIGFGNAQTGASKSSDRQLVLRNDGKVTFGVSHASAYATVTSGRAVNDGRWHHLVATMSPDEGLRLYVDGAKAGENATGRTALNMNGYWRVGGDAVAAGWPSVPTSAYLAGDLDEVAVYSQPLTADEVMDHYTAGGGAGTANAAPVAAFAATTAGLAASFDATASGDTDGSIASYAWRFGDGDTAGGATPSHSYAAAGTYPVTLTVTDNRGAVATVTKNVTVAVPNVWARDQFARSVAGGLGSAEIGGPWTVTGGASNTSVSAGAARIRLAAPGATVSGVLGQVGATNAETELTVALDRAATGGGTYVRLQGRRVAATTLYQGRLRFLSDGTVQLALMRSAAGTDTVLGATLLPGLGYQPGGQLRVRLQVQGTAPTALRIKAWPQGSAEPDWQLTTTDATPALQVPGAVGIEGYLSGSTTNAPAVVTVTDWVTRKL